MEEEIFDDVPMEGIHNKNMVLVATIIIDGMVIMYEWLPKEEADAKAKDIYRGQFNNGVFKNAI